MTNVKPESKIFETFFVTCATLEQIRHMGGMGHRGQYGRTNTKRTFGTKHAPYIKQKYTNFLILKIVIPLPIVIATNVIWFFGRGIY